MTDTGSADPFQQLRDILKEAPDADEEARAAAVARNAELTKPAGSLGRLEELVSWLAAWQGKAMPTCERPMVTVFAGNHGVAAKGVSAYPADVTGQMVKNFIDGGAAVNQIAGAFDAGLKVFELALEMPTGDITEGPALTDVECMGTVAFGMQAVEQGYDLAAVGEMGIGNSTAAAALAMALYGGTAEDWAGPGTGVGGAAFERKLQAVTQAAERNASDDPLHLLARLGGREFAAIAGVIVAARYLRLPVLLDGFSTTAAAATLERAHPGALDHCLAAHVSAEPGHRRLLGKLGKQPLLDLDMRLGEGSGAALAIGVVKAAVATHAGMKTFEEAGVSGPA